MKTNKKLVSIILPTYNSKKFIKKSIKSVLNQTYNNFELIIVDDCSTDDTYKIIRKLKNQDNRIKYFRTKKNSKTAGHPRNVGIKIAKGDLIAFIDVDDYWYPSKLKYQIEGMKEKDILSCTASNYVQEDMVKKSNVILNYIRIFIQSFIFKKLKNGQFHWLYVYNPVIFSSAIIKKNIFKKIKFSEDENIREDLFFWFKFFPLIKNDFNFESKILCTITRVKGSLSSGFKKEFNKIINSVSKNFFDENNFSKFHFFLIGIFFRTFKTLISTIYLKFRKYFLYLFSIFVFFYFLIFYSPLFWYFGKQLIAVDKFQKTDSIVLISGHDKPNYFNDSYQQRYYDIIEILKEYEITPKIFIIGRNQILPEEKILKALLLDYGLEKEKIYDLAENKKNTKDNLIYIYKELKKNNLESATIITAPYHTLRTRLLINKQNFKFKFLIYQKTPIKNNFFSRALNKKIIIYEFFAILINKIRGWL